MLFLFQRVNQCLQDVCSESHFSNCKILLDCGRGNNSDATIQSGERQNWLDDNTSALCFDPSADIFQYGIYQQAVLLTTKSSVVKRYIYSLFWGFQVPLHMLP